MQFWHSFSNWSQFWIKLESKTIEHTWRKYWRSKRVLWRESEWLRGWLKLFMGVRGYKGWYKWCWLSKDALKSLLSLCKTIMTSKPANCSCRRLSKRWKLASCHHSAAHQLKIQTAKTHNKCTRLGRKLVYTFKTCLKKPSPFTSTTSRCTFSPKLKLKNSICSQQNLNFAPWHPTSRKSLQTSWNLQKTQNPSVTGWMSLTSKKLSQRPQKSYF